MKEERLKEVWKKVEHNLEVSSHGRVRHQITGHELKVYTNNTRNFPSVYTYTEGKKWNHKVHRLVAEAFVPNPNNLREVEFLDGDKGNSYFLNLRWCSMEDSRTRTLGKKVSFRSPKGERVDCSSLSEMAREYGLNVPSLSLLSNGKKKSYKGWTLWE